jgi:protein gp37
LSQYKLWNPWRGCFRVSEACQNCFIQQLGTFEDRYYPPQNLDVYTPGTIITVCLQSDFFLAEADKYRALVWNEIKTHPNLIFKIITKRVERIAESLPEDWNSGYENVIFCVTVENQKRADERLPIFMQLPAKHKWIACTPLLEKIDISKHLKSNEFEMVEVLGERSYHGSDARPLLHSWVLFLHDECKKNNVGFALLGVGGNYHIDARVLSDRCRCYSSPVADRLAVNYYRPITFTLKNSLFTI